MSVNRITVKSKSIDRVIEIAGKNMDEDVVKQMKRIVPEYISNNSIYESMDEEIFTPALSSHG